LRKKEKPPKTRTKNNKVVYTEVTYQLKDDFGDVLRKAEFPFPQGKLTKTEVVLLDLDTIEEALL